MKKALFLVLILFTFYSITIGQEEAALEKIEFKSSSSVQCSGTTKAGNRCKNKTLNVSGYCYLHESQQSDKIEFKSQEKTESKITSVQCTGTTKAGNR